MKTYHLKLVRSGLSILLFMFLVILFLTIAIVVVIIFSRLPKATFLIILFSMIGSFTYVLWRFYDKLLIKYKATLIISDQFFELNQSRYSWEDVEWHRTDTNSAIMNGFIVGIKGLSSLKFHVTNKKGDELETWEEMKKDFMETLASKNIKIRNYYNSLNWRRTARLLLVSNVVLPTLLLSTGIDFLKILPGYLAWLSVSVVFSLMIFNNQKK